MLKPLDLDLLRERFQTAQPFRFVVIDGLLSEDFAQELVSAYPSFDRASQDGFRFDWVNEKKKVQITDVSRFPQAVKRLHEQLASDEFRDALAHITGIPKLLADERLEGGGIHVTGPQGRLDVHVDFNYLQARRLHRRLNLLLYLNPRWKQDWGGFIELWDKDVKRCVHRFEPVLNRCLVFETSDISYHGVTAVTCPPDVERRSFAAYYYTREAPANWDGRFHDTRFRARPDEKLRGWVYMPAEKLQRRLVHGLRSVKQGLRAALFRFTGFPS